jgi:hypothetical protein
MFTLDIGAKVVLTFSVNNEQLRTTAVVATRYPQVGNGFDFVDMTPVDRLKLTILLWLLIPRVLDELAVSQ